VATTELKTQHILVARGTTAQRPTAQSGQLRYNTSNNEMEVYNGTNWVLLRGQDTTSP
jgi:hypothetical protein